MTPSKITGRVIPYGPAGSADRGWLDLRPQPAGAPACPLCDAPLVAIRNPWGGGGDAYRCPAHWGGYTASGYGSGGYTAADLAAMARIATRYYTSPGTVWRLWIGLSVEDFLAGEPGRPPAGQVERHCEWLHNEHPQRLARAVWGARYGHLLDADPDDPHPGPEHPETVGLSDRDVERWILRDLQAALAAYAETNAPPPFARGDAAPERTGPMSRNEITATGADPEPPQTP